MVIYSSCRISLGKEVKDYVLGEFYSDDGIYYSHRADLIKDLGMSINCPM